MIYFERAKIMFKKKINDLIKMAKNIFSKDRKYYYEDAEKDVHEGVVYAIKEFRNLPEEEKENLPLLYYLLKKSTPAFKMSKEDSNYIEVAQGSEKCSNCRFIYKRLIDGKYICSQVADEIKPEAWCKLWKP